MKNPSPIDRLDSYIDFLRQQAAEACAAHSPAAAEITMLLKTAEGRRKLAIVPLQVSRRRKR